MCVDNVEKNTNKYKKTNKKHVEKIRIQTPEDHPVASTASNRLNWILLNNPILASEASLWFLNID